MPKSAISAHDLRKQLKKQRSQLPLITQQLLSHQAVKHLSQQRVFKAARNIALYLPVRGETDPRLLRHYAQSKQRFFLPVLSLSHNSKLMFVEWSQNTRFKLNRFNIQEPTLKTTIINPSQLDLVITPLVAFDLRGTRLGMGGGFYDRSFAIKQHRIPSQPYLVGFAYPFQQVAYLERQKWDIPLNACCTAHGFIQYNG